MKTIFLTSILPQKLPVLPPGKWAAIDSNGIILAVGDTLKVVLEEARSKGETMPIVTGDLLLPAL